MRVALLSMTMPSDNADGGYRASIEFAGRSIALRQLDLALALGCERIICLADHLHQPLLPLQHRCEAAGARFHVVTGPRPLVALLRATDELLVLAEGLLPLEKSAFEQLSKHGGVLVLPAETGIPAGFERVDINHAWAGALSMPGRLVERLAELPPDCDVVGSLLRVALQSRVQEIQLPDAVLAEGRWPLVMRREQAAALEPSWLRRHLPQASGFSPFSFLAKTLLSLFGVSLLRAGKRTGAYLALAPILALGGVALGLGFSPMLGFLLAVLSFIAAQLASGLYRLEAASRGEGAGQPLFERVQAWLLDGCLAAITAYAVQAGQGGLGNGIFAGIALIALLRLLAMILSASWTSLANDRGVLGLALAVAAATNTILPVAQIIIVIGLVSGLAIQHLRQR